MVTTLPGKIFQSLAVWIDTVARDGPEQMACDEALLNLTGAPVLRVFRWARPWVSAGYFIPFIECEMNFFDQDGL